NREIPNSFYPNQYDNPSNAQAHYESTGPEIWAQTEGKVDHLVVGVGTGGTICGVAKFLKEKNPKIKVWGIDTYGSVFKKYKETGIFDKNEIYPYVTEGIGEDFLPKNVDFNLIDHFEKVTDKDAALMTRQIVKQEGIWVGNSAGSAVAGLIQLKDNFKEGETVVVIFHDHGTRYLGKIFNDDWMRSKGYTDKKGMTAKDVVASNKNGDLITVKITDTIGQALKLITENSISQLPVTQDNRIVGSINEDLVFKKIIENPDITQEPVKTIMTEALPFIDASTSLDVLAGMVTKANDAVLAHPFCAHHLHRGLAQAGRSDLLLANIRERWGAMVDTGST
ncbi:MAG TPA: pyridoxal-phosphate dependent enzyme, partial [Bacteroidia bacterium]|nr:pyridoxal-phosphate dependent enzyme [Bacteroidia bacterium]